MTNGFEHNKLRFVAMLLILLITASHAFPIKKTLDMLEAKILLVHCSWYMRRKAAMSKINHTWPKKLCKYPYYDAQRRFLLLPTDLGLKSDVKGP